MTSAIHQNLLLKVIAKQHRAHLNDYAFSNALGIERSTWTHTRIGRRLLGLTVIRAILRIYPDLTDDVLTYLRDGSKAEQDADS